MSQLVSVIMPLYNGRAFLDAAVESLLAQSWTTWELMIVDDGSSDDSLERARAWAKRDERIQALQHPGGANKGVSATRNRGIEESRGEWIALFDCDDVWFPDKLQRQMDVLKAHPEVTLVYSRAQVVDDEGREVTDRIPTMKRPPIFGRGRPGVAVNDFVGFMQGKYWPPASSVVFSRKAAAACGNFRPMPYQVEDTLLFAMLSERGAMWMIDDVLIHYRVHGNQWNSRLDPVKHLEGRFCYQNVLVQTLDGDSREEAAAAIVDTLRNLSQSLVSPRKLRVFRLARYTGSVLTSGRVPFQFKLAAVGILFKRLLQLPVLMALRARYVLRGPDAGQADTAPAS